MPYDWESGLVFDETVKRYHGNACLQELFSVRKPKGHHVRLSTGSDKMWEMAIRLLLHNLDSLSVDALKALEIAMLERLHKIISESYVAEVCKDDAQITDSIADDSMAFRPGNSSRRPANSIAT